MPQRRLRPTTRYIRLAMAPKLKPLTALALVLAAAGAWMVLVSQPRGPRPALLGGPAGAAAAPSDFAPVAAGDLAAAFALRDLEGKTVSLAALRGKVVFLNLWATWCAPCREEMPSMEALYERFKQNPKFAMLAVSQDAGDPKSVTAKVAAYVKRHGYRFKVLLDPEGGLAQAYHLTGVPETFIIDQNGRIIAHHVGAFDWTRPDFESVLAQLLREGKT